MAIESWRIAAVKGSDPEQFIVVGLDLAHRQGEPFMKTSKPMTEEELRKELASRGMSKIEIEASIASARENQI